MTSGDQRRPRVGLFITCLVDLMRASVGLAAVRLLEAAGCEAGVPRRQTCCGQPAYNGGDRQAAKAIALATMDAFAGYDYVVAPSGSCAGMLKLHYPRLMAGDAAAEARARAFALRVHELTSFLVDVRGLTAVPGTYKGRIAYHDGCSGLRELGVRRQPRKLLSMMAGVELIELAEPEACCGFGGLFSVNYPDISTAIATRKTATIAAAAPDLLVAGDLGCLISIAGTLAREGSSIPCRHVAEVLAGEVDAPAIARGSQGG